MISNDNMHDCTLDNCIISGAHLTNITINGGVIISDSSVDLSNCTFFIHEYVMTSEEFSKKLESLDKLIAQFLPEELI